MAIPTRGIVTLALLSFVFLGSAGCGCGDDDLGSEIPETCCCLVSWEHTQTSPNLNITVAIEPGYHHSLAPVSIFPTSFTNLPAFTPATFEVCVNENHQLFAPLTITITDNATGGIIATFMGIYDPQCELTEDDTIGTGSWDVICSAP